MAHVFQVSIALLAVILSFSVQGDEIEEKSHLSSHCHSHETAYLNANMKKVIRDPSFAYQPTGKVLSICFTDSEADAPMIVYRYGKIGNVEFEKIATPVAPFYYYHFTLYPQASKVNTSVLFFSNGKFNYYVGQALGMGSGISLSVYRDGKQLVELFSGNDKGIDYDYGTEIYSRSMKDLPRKVFVDKTPTDKEMRSPYILEIIKRRYKEIYDEKEHKLLRRDSMVTGDATAYVNQYVATDIERINTTFYAPLGNTKYQVYYDYNGSPFFILQQIYTYNAPATMTEARVTQLKEEEGVVYQAYDPAKTTREEWRYYYDGDYVVKVVNPQKEIDMDLERAKEIRHIGLDLLKEFINIQ
ncbi:hypothetical protein CBF23_001055 [Marinomonas agarivorans]|nr:hypothetical protein CBF23_001055 [Marinomonas agarivorans]